MHEDLDIHAFAVVIQLIGHHLTDWNFAVINRRAGAQRTQAQGMQGKAFARFAIGDGRRVFQAFEVFGAGVGLADVGTDVVAGQQGVDAGHATGADARADNPEL